MLLGIPSPKEQTRITEIYEANGLLLNQELEKFRKLEILKTGLMQDLLTGKVSVEQMLEKTLTLVS
jgi:type I restriction enzyme, S subunit